MAVEFAPSPPHPLLRKALRCAALRVTHKGRGAKTMSHPIFFHFPLPTHRVPLTAKS